ncbi:hypothetical protein F5884DRAFT_890684 [Xylogone sp. PMI_703]|nr:hypothetical protein F5884DRAFT_890684 [Xylogone sp. PMI_703]
MDPSFRPNLSFGYRPTSSIYSEDVSTMAELVRAVSEEARQQEHQTVTSYVAENRLLEEEIEIYRKKWNETIMVVNELLQAIIAIKTSLNKVAKKVAVAERDWLAFWGIYKESDGSHPPWI